jgi:hypothetical protein
MDAILSTVPVVLQQIFAGADALARQVGFVKRARKLQPSTFVQVFCLFLIRYPRASLQQLGDELNITASALCQRLKAKAAAHFLRGMLGSALKHLTSAALRPVCIPLLRRFNGVYLVDGTVEPLPASLAYRFAGCGGGEKPDDPSALSAVKILLRLRLDIGQAVEMFLAAARIPDIKLLKRLARLPKGALQIGDLGFFDSGYFKKLIRQGVYWLTRLPARVSVRAQDGAWQELAYWLRDLEQRGIEKWEGLLEIVQGEPVQARVFVKRCPPQEAERRRRKLRERMRRKGKTAGERQLILCDWWVLATNAPTDKLRMSEASELYRCRWQIELVFKRWKSLGGLSIDRGHAEIRAECELYGKLMGVLIIDWMAIQRGGMLAGVSQWHAWRIVLALLPQIVLALKGQFDWCSVLKDLVTRLDRRAKQHRRKDRPSTRQRLFRATVAN